MQENNATKTQSCDPAQDTVQLFMEDQCTYGAPHSRVSSRHFYAAYKQWAEQKGMRPASETALGRALRQWGCIPVNAWIFGRRTRCWKGVRLATESASKVERV